MATVGSAALGGTSEVSSVIARSRRRWLADGSDGVAIFGKADVGVDLGNLAASDAVVNFTIVVSMGALTRGFTLVSAVDVAASDDEWARTPQARAAASSLEATVSAASYDGTRDAAAAVMEGMPFAKKRSV
jgi:hypothetical protein